MKPFWMLVLAGAALAAVVAVAVACDGGDDDDAPAEVRVSKDDTAATVARGGKLLIELEANPSTGFTWNVQAPAPATLEFTGEPSVVPTAASGTPAVGAPVRLLYTFVAKETGTATLVLEYRRPWESVPPAQTYTIKVTVN
ncbi:MAG: protease inhibitor I42 family protein [Dehalococcoidia bacterium]